MIWKD